MTFALLALTEPRLAIVWDEGYTLGRVARLRLWVRALVDPPGFAERWSPRLLSSGYVHRNRPVARDPRQPRRRYAPPHVRGLPR